MTLDVEKLPNMTAPKGMDFDIAKVGRVVVQVAVEFRDPDKHSLEIYWGVDRVGASAVSAPHVNGTA